MLGRRSWILAFPLLFLLPAAWAVWSSDPGTDVQVDTDPISNTVDPVQIVPDGAGGGIVVSPTPYVTAQRLNAQGDPVWTSGGTQGVRLTQIADAKSDLTAIQDGQGGAFAAWAEDRGQGLQIFVQHVDASGSLLWGMDGALATVGAQPALPNPQLAPDGAGGVIVVWADLRSGNNFDLFAQRLDAAGQRLWVPSGAAVVTAPQHQRSARILGDGAGGGTVVWEDQRNLLSGSTTVHQDDVYAQRLDATGMALWAPDGIPVCMRNTDYQNLPKVVPDGMGGGIVSWIDGRTASGVYAQRVAPNGTLLWMADGVPALPQAFMNHDLMADGAGGAILAWGVDDVFAQRLDGSGSLQWGGGVTVSAAVGYQREPLLAGTPNGGAVVLWRDSRAGPDPMNPRIEELYAQRLGFDGHTTWQADGVLVSRPASGGRGPFQAAGDGVGGAILAYHRFSSAFPFAKRVLPSGELGVSPPGVAGYGVSTPGCAGALAIGVASVPRAGQPFELTCANAPPNGRGWLVAGVRADVPGRVIQGVRIHIDTTARYVLIPATANAAGGGSVRVNLPASPGRIGHFQFVWNNPPGCPGRYQTSDALAATLQ